MAGFDALPAPQRAVLSLVIQSGLGYDEVATMLGVDRSTVRARAQAGLEGLVAPDGGSAAHRALVTDLLLGQLPPRAAEMTREQLERSPADRAWADAAAAAVESLSRGPHARGDESPMARVPRRSSKLGGAILLIVLAAACASVAIVLLSRSGSGHGGTASAPGTTLGAAPGTDTAASGTQPTATTPAAQTSTLPGGIPRRLVTATLLLRSPNPANSATIGLAYVLRGSRARGIVLGARGLAANPPHHYYAVWLGDPQLHFRLLGFAPRPVTRGGTLAVDTVLPADAARFSQLFVTLESRAHPSVPGKVVLEGAFRVS